MTSRAPIGHVTTEGAGGSTVGYPSDSLASCFHSVVRWAFRSGI